MCGAECGAVEVNLMRWIWVWEWQRRTQTHTYSVHWKENKKKNIIFSLFAFLERAHHPSTGIASRLMKLSIVQNIHMHCNICNRIEQKKNQKETTNNRAEWEAQHKILHKRLLCVLLLFCFFISLSLHLNGCHHFYTPNNNNNSNNTQRIM